MASYDLKAILGEKLRRLTDKTLKALVDCMCTVGASLCSLDKRVSALESVELPEGGYKPMQEPVASPSASSTAIAFIDTIAQDATGRMTATKKTVRTGSGSQTGVLKLSDSTSSTSGVNGGIAATPAAVKAAYDYASGKYAKPSDGIPKTDLASEVQTSLGKADTALQTHQDISGKVDKTAVSGLADWDTLTDTGIYEIASQASNVAHSPESNMMTLIVIEPASGFKIQLAMGYHTYRRYYHRVSTNPDTYEWTSWTALVETGSTPLKIVRDTALGTDVNTLYIV